MATKIRMRRAIASSENWAYRRGQELRVGSSFSGEEVPRETAEAWLSSGIAELVESEEERTADLPAPPEKAISRRRRS